MKTPLTTSQHLRNIASLGLPLIGSHVAQFAVNLTDSVMLGWYDVEVLAAQVIGATLFFVLFIMGSGFAWAVMPMVAEALESGETAQVRRLTRMAGWASVLFATVAALPLVLLPEQILLLLGQEPDTAARAAQYLVITGWSIFPALLVMVLKSYLAALERAQVVLWVTLGAVLVNALVNYALIFGNWGLPELGIQGAAIASLAVQLVSLLLMALYAARVTAEHDLFSRFWRSDWEALGRVFRLGWPIGMTNLAEVGLFAASSVMMGWLGTLPLAAHGIALQITSFTFMVHVGLSNAATVRAGRAWGRKSPVDLKAGARIVILISMVFALITLTVFLTTPEPLISLFLSPDDPNRAEVMATAVVLLAAAGLFQFADAGQVMAVGLLRGVQDTRVPMIFAAVSYWLIGVPVSYLLGFQLGYGGFGVWLGLAIGLAFAGVLLMLRFWIWATGKAEHSSLG